MSLEWLILLPCALVASLAAAFLGTGAAVILLPILTAVFGVRDAVPLYALVQFSGNLARIGFNWRDIDWAVVWRFALGALPAAVLGAWLFTVLPDVALTRLLGAFLLLSVLWRHAARRSSERRFPVNGFVPVGSAFALVSSLVGSAGPFVVPFYVGYGLVRSAFIGTEAAGTAFVHIFKLASYEIWQGIPATVWLHGLLLAPAMLLGAWLGRRWLKRVSETVFLHLVDVVLLLFGVFFLLLA